MNDSWRRRGSAAASEASGSICHRATSCMRRLFSFRLQDDRMCEPSKHHTPYDDSLAETPVRAFRSEMRLRCNNGQLGAARRRGSERGLIAHVTGGHGVLAVPDLGAALRLGLSRRGPRLVPHLLRRSPTPESSAEATKSPSTTRARRHRFDEVRTHLLGRRRQLGPEPLDGQLPVSRRRVHPSLPLCRTTRCSDRASHGAGPSRPAERW